MAQPESKKAKTVCNFNVNNALDKEHEGKSLRTVISLPPSALQGIAEHSDEVLRAFKVKTIEDLANWKYARIARSIATLAPLEEDGKRDESSVMNINKALDKDRESKTLKELLNAPLSSLQGLADWTDDVFKKLHLHTVADLAKWKYVAWAESLVALAEQESEDGSS